ncbi:MAG TPA: branched-chain amino acid ABC transporter permease, partial [Deltaproteobacteria bacterium]|nr:branched-chain amino acid ABC transporter permease [Deltaproteobacteria bacterium]
FTVRDFKALTGLNEGFGLKTSQAITIITTIILCSLLFFFLNKTRTGKSMRAFSDNEDLALLSGINPEKVVRATWFISAVFITLAGVLYGLDKSYKPLVYFHLLLPIFAAAIVGGIGQPIGAILGGYIVAFSEVTATYAFKKFLRYLGPEGWSPDSLVQFLSTEYKFAVSFLILVLVLLIRPTGLFKGRVL